MNRFCRERNILCASMMPGHEPAPEHSCSQRKSIGGHNLRPEAGENYEYCNSNRSVAACNGCSRAGEMAVKVSAARAVVIFVSQARRPSPFPGGAPSGNKNQAGRPHRGLTRNEDACVSGRRHDEVRPPRRTGKFATGSPGVAIAMHFRLRRRGG